MLDVYGGEYEWDNTTVKLHSQRGTDRGVTIRYGKNLTDLTQEESCAEVYTGQLFTDNIPMPLEIRGDKLFVVK